METQVRVSCSGVSKTQLKREIWSVLATMHFRRRSSSEFSRSGDLLPEEVLKIVNHVYERERLLVATQVVTLVISSTLMNINIRRNKNRSI